MLNALGVVCVRNDFHSHALNTDVLCVCVCTSLFIVIDVLLFLHMSFYMPFCMAVYSRIGTVFSKALLNKNEHASIGDSSSRMPSEP